MTNPLCTARCVECKKAKDNAKTPEELQAALLRKQRHRKLCNAERAEAARRAGQATRDKLSYVWW